MEGIFAGEGDELVIEVCRQCYLLWFDRGELEKMPRTPAVPEMPAEARRALAMAQVEAVATDAKLKKQRLILETMTDDYARRPWYSRSGQRDHYYDDGYEVLVSILRVIGRLLR